MTFLKKAWEWLKKYWKWLLFPIGILLLVIGYLSRKKVEVIAPGSTAANAAAAKAKELADKQAAAAEAERLKRVEELKKEHEAVIQKLTDAQQKQVEELEGDPDKLNAYLLDVGRQMRG